MPSKYRGMQQALYVYSSPVFVEVTVLTSHDCHAGVKGIVKDGITGLPVAGAMVVIEGRLHFSKTTVLGEFWRILLPGNYVIKVQLRYRYLVLLSSRICPL